MTAGRHGSGSTVFPLPIASPRALSADFLRFPASHNESRPASLSPLDTARPKGNPRTAQKVPASWALESISSIKLGLTCQHHGSIVDLLIPGSLPWPLAVKRPRGFFSGRFRTRHQEHLDKRRLVARRRLPPQGKAPPYSPAPFAPAHSRTRLAIKSRSAGSDASAPA